MQEEEKSVEPSPLPEVESKTKRKQLLEMNGNRLTKSGAVEGNKDNLMKSGKEEGRWWCSQVTAISGGGFKY